MSIKVGQRFGMLRVTRTDWQRSRPHVRCAALQWSTTTSGGWRSPATPTQSKSMSFLWMRPPRRARGGVSE